MNAALFDSNKNITIKGVNLYEDCANNRLKILDYHWISENVVKEIIGFAAYEELGKIIFTCRAEAVALFCECGFIVEGTINGFFRGEDGYCISYYVDKNRKTSRQEQAENDIMHKCQNTETSFIPITGEDILFRNADKTDIQQMIALFSAVFTTYPSPVFSSEYLKSVMNGKTIFKVAVQSGKIISIASAEVDIINLNAEMTDCATYPQYRGKGLLTNLMFQLESELKSNGFYTLYSLCRATEPGINKALCKLQYNYTGRLINNCNICGSLEDMNIWVKRLK